MWATLICALAIFSTAVAAPPNLRSKSVGPDDFIDWECPGFPCFVVEVEDDSSTCTPIQSSEYCDKLMNGHSWVDDGEEGPLHEVKQNHPCKFWGWGCLEFANEKFTCLHGSLEKCSRACQVMDLSEIYGQRCLDHCEHTCGEFATTFLATDASAIEPTTSETTTPQTDNNGAKFFAYILAILSAFFNGSFPNWKRIECDEADSVVFNGIVGMGAFLSSVLVPLCPILVSGELIFSPCACLGGGIFVCATLCTFIAIPKVGLGIACAVWSCSAIFTSFLWGVAGPEQVRSKVGNWLLALLSLLFLAVGAVVIVSAEALANRFFSEPAVSDAESFGDAAGGSRQLREGGDTPGTPADGVQRVISSSFAIVGPTSFDGDVQRGSDNAGGKIVGLFFSAGVGVFGGSVLVPMKFVEGATGLQTVISFGIGAMLCSTMVTLIYAFGIAREPRKLRVSSRSVLAGILAGTTWNAGNVLQIIVQDPDMFGLPYGVAYPLNQCGMFFAGIWSIFFAEIRGKSILVFWVGAIVLSIGVILLGAYGPGA